MPMDYRFATSEDAVVLVEMNQKLIRDEGHRNSMNVEQLASRMTDWLRGEYQAVLFEDNGTAVGYSLFRREPDFVYVRQLFVVAEQRRRGIARQAIDWLSQHVWRDAVRVRIDVLVDNVAGRAFWRSVGFRDYCVTMEAELPDLKKSTM